MSRRPAAAPDPSALAASWLMSAAQDPQLARAQWDEEGVTLLPCGALFGVVRVPDPVVHAAAGTVEWPDTAEYLRRVLGGGAVFAHPRGRHHYALISLASARLWRDREAEALGSGTYIGVPAPERTEPDGVDAYWAVPLTRPGALCGPVTLGRFLAAGRAGQARAEREGGYRNA